MYALRQRIGAAERSYLAIGGAAEKFETDNTALALKQKTAPRLLWIVTSTLL